jgi:L,D-transpeptidase catalytic domain
MMHKNSRMRPSHRMVLVGLFTFMLLPLAVFNGPASIALPEASPQDKSIEDLSRISYPSQKGILWQPHFILPNETLESLFGKDWIWVARFNRVDRRHAYPGMTIKVPLRMSDIREYSPLPKEYEPARKHRKYILLDIGEQWIGAYERGKLKFSMPAATGKAGTETPTGLFRIDARHLTHTSSLYKIAEEGEQYPMDNALRFFIDEKNVSYWIHARDLPGKPASHGCIGLFDEEMQERVYDTPKKPVLKDSQKLYAWAAPDEEHGDDDGSVQELAYGPVVEIRGTLPVYR